VARELNHAKDGAKPVPWGDYSLHLLLVVATVTLATLRIVGAVQWSWLVVLIPLLVLIAVFVASVLAAVQHSDR
jgi:hypothetical protein